MTGSELYTHVNETLRVLVWPITAIVLAGFLRSPVVRIFDRFAMLEGSVGGVSFKISLEKYVQETVSKAVDLERQGRINEAQELVKSASSMASIAFGLSDDDIKYLLSLADGARPKGRWGKVHLVRAGLVDLDGGELTPKGKEFVNL